MLKSTNRHKKYWEKRDIDWNKAYFNIEHPHRRILMHILKKWQPMESLFEIGCAAGANLYLAANLFKNLKVGGVDVNKDAIEHCQKLFPYNDKFEVRSGENIFMSDRSISVVLTDMTLIYFGPFKIRKALKEIKRITRERVLFCEFHHTNPFKRWALRLFTGYNAYNWKNLLERRGYYDIEIYKLTEQDWVGGNPQKDFGCIISARIPL